jgi:aspartyl-tRNA(Asn)/glutamyl-tRNA(Gln) amidotransferase subunit A
LRGRIGDGIAGLRVAFSPTLGYVAVDDEVAAAVRAAVEVLAALGAHVTEVDPGFTDPVRAYHVLWFSGAAKALEHLPPGAAEQLDPGLKEVVAEGRALSALDYLEAMAQRMALGCAMGRFHERFDLLVTPTLPIAAFAAGTEVPPGWPAPRWTSWTPFTYPFNLTQQPAVSVPCGRTVQGLPIGLQIVGPRHADARVLAAAKAYEDVTTERAVAGDTVAGGWR